MISIATEFVENSGTEETKQDCELKACCRLMEKLKTYFPRLPICIGADSLYAGEPFIRRCKGMGWHYKELIKETNKEEMQEKQIRFM